MKTYRNFPAIKLPAELREGFADDELVTVTISLWNEDEASDEPQLSPEQIAEVRRRINDPDRHISSDEIDTEIAKGIEDVRAKRFREFTPKNAKDMTAGFKTRFKTSE